MNPEDEAEEDGANVDLDSQRKGKCVVLKTSTRQVSFLFVGFGTLTEQLQLTFTCYVLAAFLYQIVFVFFLGYEL